MYEETKSSIDWKGIILKVIIAFLVVLIGIKGYSTLKGNNNKKNTTSETIVESKSTSTFTENIEKLRSAGEKYYKDNTDKLPKEKGNTTMITLNELINKGVITELVDEKGKTCDGESSYVTATSEGNKTKIKANLVCGSASSYKLVYMGENDTETKEETKTTTSNGTTTINKTSSSSVQRTENSCGMSCATPSIKVETKAEQKVTINESTKKPVTTTTTTTTKKVKYYTVSFDSNGGNKQYRSQEVKENNTAYNPGSTERSGYYFLGWYLNGEKYDFSRPVTRNITLIARYSYDRYDYDYDYDYDYNYNYNDRDELVTRVFDTTVYTMGWYEYGTERFNINHTLKLPKVLENKDPERVRIKRITYSGPINTKSRANTYLSKHYDTFFYSNNGWESLNYNEYNLSTIRKNAVSFAFDDDYKSLYEATREGFDVTWYTKDVESQCRSTFSVNGVGNNCNYGIYYTVTWEYQYYR